jgi:glucosylceramidase
LLKDTKANACVSAVGYQWDGLYSVRLTRTNYPDKKIVQTETECGNWPFKGGYNPNEPPNDWTYGSYTWGKVKEYFEQGVNSYMLWNMVLDREGKNLDYLSPWPQNAAIVVDTDKKSYALTPMYYAFKHFSYFVRPGASFLKLEFNGEFTDAAAFKNPDGTIVLELQNASDAEKGLKIGYLDRAVIVKLPAKSWSTLILP